jgi:hypothetical protein
MYRHHPIDARGNLIYQPTRRSNKRKRRPTFPDGYANIKFPENRGKYTKAAKSLRAELRAQLGMVKVMRRGRKK